MPPVSRSTLRNLTMATALLGQWTLTSSPQFGILLCGVSLGAALLDGWWYLQPLGKMWWYPALWGLIGLTMWDEPRGWFFLAWSAIDIGTGLRAQSIIRRWERARAEALAEEKARQERLASLGFEVAAAAEAAPDDSGEREPEAPPAPPPPIALWRYPLAIGFGLIGALLGGWGTRIFFAITGWQMDILAIATGYLVAKGITIGAGDRSNKVLQGVSAALTVLGVFYGRYLMFSYLLFDQKGLEPQPALLVMAMLSNPVQAFGLWMVLYVAVGAWSGWQYARDPGRGGKR